MKTQNCVPGMLIFLVLLGCQSTPRYDDTLLDCASMVQKDRDLFYGVKFGDLSPEEVTVALKKGANVNVSDRLDQTILMWACWNGDAEIIQVLLDAKRVDVTKTSTAKSYPLSYNALFCFMASPRISVNETTSGLLKQLIRKNPKVLKQKDFFGENVLHKIIREPRKSGFADVLVSSVSNFPKDLFETENIHSESPLQLALKKQNRSMVHFLLKNGVSVEETPESFDDSLLGLAFKNGDGNYQIYTELLQAKLTAENARKLRPGNKSAKGFSSEKEKNELETRINRLKDEAPRPNLERFFVKYTAYEIECKKNPGNPTVLDEQESFDEQLKFLTLLRDAKDSDASKIREFLIQSPYLANARITEGQADSILEKTPLQLAIETGSEMIYKTVIANVDIETLDPPGDASDYFSIAVVRKNLKVMKHLVESYTKGGIRNSENLISSASDAGCYDTYVPESPVFQRKRITATWQRFLITPEVTNDEITGEVLDFYGDIFSRHVNCYKALQMFLEIEQFSLSVFDVLFKKYNFAFRDPRIKPGDTPLAEYLLQTFNRDSEDIQARKAIVLSKYADAEFFTVKELQTIRDTIKTAPEKYPDLLALIASKLNTPAEDADPAGKPASVPPEDDGTTFAVLDYKGKKQNAPVPSWALPSIADIAALPEFKGQVAYHRYATGEKLKDLEKEHKAATFQATLPAILAGELFREIPNRDSDPFTKKLIAFLEKTKFKGFKQTDFWQQVQVPGSAKPEYRYYTVYTISQADFDRQIAAVVTKIEKTKAETPEETGAKTIVLEALQTGSAATFPVRQREALISDELDLRTTD